MADPTNETFASQTGECPSHRDGLKDDEADRSSSGMFVSDDEGLLSALSTEAPKIAPSPLESFHPPKTQTARFDITKWRNWSALHLVSLIISMSLFCCEQEPIPPVYQVT